MAARERSKGGCWTCKLRKKKCDEGHPRCATCLSLKIDCHGYSSKPAWMDGGPGEKAKLESWRQKVKEITNHKRKLRGRHNAIRSLHVDGPDEPDDISKVTTPEEAAHLTPTSLPPLHRASPLGWTSERLEDLPRDNGYSILQLPTPAVSDLDPKESGHTLPQLREKEVGLLIYYMDYVFPLQFPFYKHSAIKGGRGWLLSLLMQLEPLYHAALSVAVYHQHYEEWTGVCEARFGNLERVPSCPRLEFQLEEHILTLSRINTLLQRLENMDNTRSKPQLSEYVELISCMAFLISLEILEGSSGSWHIHLKAASYIVPLARQAYQSDQVNDLSDTHKQAYQFFTNVILWSQYQLVASLGNMPVTDLEIEELCASSDDFPGCEDWVCREILNITNLAHWKETMKSKNQLSNRELTTQAQAIDTKLKNGMNALSTRTDITTTPLDFLGKPETYTKLLVTRIYGYCAMIYLYTIESGPNPDVAEINTNVSHTIDALRALPRAELVRHLAWPLCLAGSMASGDQQDAFVEITEKAKIVRCPFGSSKHSLAIIKECWRVRESGEGQEGNVDWRVAMQNLGLNILLS